MNEYLFNAREELKRADHLIYVSLKYTRTVDVIKSVVERLINAFDFTIDSLLEKAKEQKQISEVPKTPGTKYNELKQLYADNGDMIKHLEFYMILRKISRAQYKRINEYRRHVTMIATVDEAIVNIDIDEISCYYERTTECVDYATELVEQEK